jgi:hypothetical protein
MTKFPSPADSVASLVARFQETTGATDDQVAGAIGYESGRVIAMVKDGRMRLPLNKVQMAEAIGVDAPRLLRSVLSEGSPELLSVLDAVLPATTWDSTDAKLMETLRKLRRDREWDPIVFDGQAVVALMVV